MDTYVASFEEVERLAESPPSHVDPKAWRGKQHVASTFALRHGEVNKVDPGKDIRYLPVQDMWEVTIRDPKVKKHRRIQHVTILSSWIPYSSRLVLVDILAGQIPSWVGKWAPSLDLRVLQTICRAKADKQRERVLYHSLRHGRITDLRRMYQLSKDQLQLVGRWVRASNLDVYNHY